MTDDKPEILRISQPQCSAVLYLGDAVLLKCSQPAEHDPSLHSITLRWREAETHVNSPEAGHGS